MVKKRTLSPEQDMAANPTENVWVQANAGTGKTNANLGIFSQIFISEGDCVAMSN